MLCFAPTRSRHIVTSRAVELNQFAARYDARVCDGACGHLQLVLFSDAPDTDMVIVTSRAVELNQFAAR
jgi:hypothetical protein